MSTEAPVERLLRALREHGCEPRKSGSGWASRCPAHEDQRASLSVGEGDDGKELLYCHAGCPRVKILTLLGLKDRVLSNGVGARRDGDGRGAQRASPRIVKSYDYKDRDGTLLYQQVRYDPKDFRFRRPDGQGGWIWDLKGVTRVPFRLPELCASDEDEPVFVVEGEKDADQLAAVGLLATTNPGGAGKWRRAYNDHLKGRHVVIPPDNDEPGRKHAQSVARSLHGVAASVKVLELPGLPPKGDVSDWLDAGRTVEELRELAAREPEWKPEDSQPTISAGAAPAAPRFPRTDAGNGELFAHLYGDRVRYDHRRKRWLLWSDHRWSPDCEAAIRVLAKDAARRRYMQAPGLSDTKERESEARWAIQAESRQRVEAALYFAVAEKPVADTGEGWDSDPWLLGCPNGVVDFRSGELRAGRPEDRITMSTGVLFDPSAACRRWEKFLREVFEDDEEMIDWLWRALGYSATGDVREQEWNLMHGRGNNGKGALIRANRRALGDYAADTPFSTFELHGRTPIPNDLAALVGRRFVTASESNEAVRLNEARVKALTGGDPVTARFLNAEFFTYTPVLKLWLSTNKLPLVSDLSFGFWRRVRLIPFGRVFMGDEIDKDLDTKLAAETPGILTWIVRGALAWQERGLEPVPASVKAATREYAEDSDDLAEFLAERCVVEDGCTVPAGELFKEYSAWADERGLKKDDRLSATAFGRRMSEKFAKKRGVGGRTYHGVGLLAKVDARSDVGAGGIPEAGSGEWLGREPLTG